jgi:uncharacterized membrane protein YgcG
MNETATIKTIRILTAIVLMAFFLTIAVVHAAEDYLNAIPEPLRPEAFRLIEKGIRAEDTLMLTHQFLALQAEQKTILSAYHTLMNAVDNGLPPEPVLNKAFEGTAKNIRPELIAAAMQKVLDRYQTSYQYVRKMLNVPKNRVQPLGNLAAEGMTAGLKPESVQEIFTALQQRAETMRGDAAQNLFDATLVSARDMSRLGASSQEVSEMLCEALKTGMDGNDMIRFRNNFMNRVHNAGSSMSGRSAGSGFGQGSSGSGGGSGGSGGGGGSK